MPPRRLAWTDRLLLLVAAVLVLLLIVRIETARADDEPFWGLEVQVGSEWRGVVALDTDIEVEVTGLVARVEVRQIFRNRGLAWSEATYRYPLPNGAAVDRLRVTVGGRVIEGEIREKTDARRQYQQARAEGRVASLVEQERANQFETRLANIGPGETVQVAIGFQARIDFRDGSYSLRLPLTFTPSWYPERGPEPGLSGTAVLNDPAIAPAQVVGEAAGDSHFLTLEVALNTALTLASLESRYHDVEVQPTPGGYHLFLADPDTRSDRAFELSWTPVFADQPQAALSTWDDGDAVYALLMLAPPLREAIAPRPREVVFIIDTSGSMAGEPLAQARAALRDGVAQLLPTDRFNLVRFATQTRRLFEVSEPADAVSLAAAADFIAELEADGGTVMAPALQAAMQLPPQDGLLRQIVFITDGAAGNEAELLLQVAEELGEARLFTVAIGSAPNAWFMRKAAAIGRGSHTHIGREDEVGERMSALWARIRNPAVQNICVDWGMEAEYYPEIVPDLYAGEPLWLYARLPFVPREVTVCGELDGHYWETRSRPQAAGGNADLPALWARSKIEALEDSRVFGADFDAIRAEVLDLALEFGLLTRYTGLVAVDRTPARPADAALEGTEVPSLLPAGSTLATGFAPTATGWQAQLALALLALAVVTAMLLYLPPAGQRRATITRSPMAAPTR
jgi:Ca-activated chloride channel family protein